MNTSRGLIIYFLLAVLISSVTTYILLTNQTKKVLTKSQDSVKKTTAPLFSVEKPPTESLKGTIASFSGTVKWQSRTATEAATMTQALSLLQGESIETMKDGNITFSISSCQVKVNPKSKLNIIQTLPSNLVFEQMEGDITYTASCSTPLSVRSSSLLIQKTTGDMRVIVDSDNQSIQIENNGGEATLGYNSLDSITTLVSLPEKTRYVYDIEQKEGTLKKLTKTH